MLINTPTHIQLHYNERLMGNNNRFFNVHRERYEVRVLWNSMFDSFIAVNETRGTGVLSRHQIDIFN